MILVKRSVREKHDDTSNFFLFLLRKLLFGVCQALFKLQLLILNNYICNTADWGSYIRTFSRLIK